MQPMNYMIDVGNPIASLQQGYQLGAGIRNDIQKQQEAEAQRIEAERQRQQQAAVIDELTSNPTADNYAKAMLIMPGAREQLKSSFELRNSAAIQNDVNEAGQLYSAIKNGAVDVAKQMLQTRLAGLENSGAPAREIQAVRAMSQLIDQNPQMVAGQALAVLQTAPGGDKILSAIATGGKEQREQELQPGLVRKGAAEAGAAESEATVKATEAKYADQKAKAAMAEAAAQLGLTKAQTNHANAAASKLSAETKQMVAEAASGGDPSKRFEAEQKLRKEYADQTKPFVEVKEAYRRVQASDNTGPGDIALIYGYMKMLDPGSVVREGEFATASNSSGVPVAIQNLYNKAISGERLTEGQRKTFKSQAGKLAGAAEIREKEVRGGIETVAKNYRLNTANIFGSAATSDSVAPTPSQPAQTAVNPQTGERLILRNGKWEPM